MTNDELVQTIYDRVSDVLDEVEKSEVEEEVNQMAGFGLPDDEIERSVVREIAENHDMSLEDFSRSGGNENATVSEVKDMGEDEWVALRATFDDEWDTAHENMVQQGLIGDSTGRIKFTSWEDANPPELEEGKSYHIQNVVTDVYNGNVSVKFTKNTVVDELDEEVEVSAGGETVEVTGAFVDFQSGSGLIKRCPEEDCTRVLQNGRCSEHGDVEGEFDLRIKGVLDDGEDTHEIILNREMTEEVTGMSMEDAKDLAMEALETSAVASEMKKDILGRYYTVTGPKAGRYVLVNEIEQVTDEPDVEELLIKARS